MHHPLRLVSDGPGWQRQIAEVYEHAFRGARSRIWLGNAYFFPTRRFARALYAASARGVDVRVLVPGTSDIGIVRRAARAQYSAWLKRGIALYEYQGPMMHAKYGIVDDDWATVGSFNALGTSLSLTVETNLIIQEARFVREAAQLFQSHLGRCRPVTRKALDGRRLGTRVLDALARAILLTTNRILHAVG